MKFKFNIIENVEGDSKHHLFSYYEVRIKLIDLFGNPETEEEHNILHKRIKKSMDIIPVFIIKQKKHNEYHKKFNSYSQRMLRILRNKEVKHENK